MELSSEVWDKPDIPGFVLEKELGRGGMGVVYQAWQPDAARRVAIKVLRTGSSDDPSERRRWQREAHAMGQLRHPNIVRLYDVGEAPGRRYLVLELVQGGSLRDRIDGPMIPELAAKLIATIARAVAVIHGVGLYHLDIKPSNILIDDSLSGSLEDANPILADFGLAGRVEDANMLSSKATGSIAPTGTPAYMAPEQFDAKPQSVCEATDVFALGATLYCLLTGRSPFQGASLVETLDLVRSREPVPPRTLVPGIHRDIETIVLKCLNKDIKDRYQSADKLAEDLGRALAGEPILARPAGPIERASKWCRRAPAVAALLTALFITVTASFLGVTSLWRRAESERLRAESSLVLSVENEATASRATADLVRVLTSTLDAPRTPTSERYEEMMRVVSEQTIKLCNLQNLASENVFAIAELEHRLAVLFVKHGKMKEAEKLMNDAVQLIEHRRLSSKIPQKLERLHSMILSRMTGMFWEYGDNESALKCADQACEAAKSLMEPEDRYQIVHELFSWRHNIARRALQRGDRKLAERAITANSQMLGDSTISSSTHPLFQLLRAIAAFQVSETDLDRMELRRAFRSIPEEFKHHKLFEVTALDWVATDIVPKPFAETVEELGDPGQYAKRLISKLRANFAECNIPREFVPQAAIRISLLAAGYAVEYRRAELYPRAEHLARWLESFGKSLRDEKPEEPSYYMIICRAFEQHAKNAWRREDKTAVEQSLRLGLSAAHSAFKLDPDDVETRSMVAAFQDKLVGVVVDEPRFKK
jgi:serine/threonine protein kinase